MKKTVLGTLALMALPFAAQAELTEAQIAADCAKISDYAKQGEQFYKAKNYPKAREAFQQQAAWLEQCEWPKDNPNKALMATAYNNIALTWVRQGDYRKAQAWLQIMPEDKKSVYNLSRIQDKLRALPKPASAAGEYWQYVGRGLWEILTLKPEGKHTYLAGWEGYHFGLMGMYSGPNLGEFAQKVTIKAGKGAIRIAEEGIYECTISLTLAPDAQSLELKTDDPTNCGFGHNVSADGTYLRVK
ncbi:hypothetical protein EDF81_1233 [Enterobacter sp. BIGb0383]|nr:hypothetical protein EDF81_1233 [Enterobacter sp. BIGb0383]ROS12887.1 hypothetical protein EC848_1235 [Enterobacter sp. BIGb0359]